MLLTPFQTMKKFLTIIILLISLGLSMPTPAGAEANSIQPARQKLSGEEVIAAINGYRQQYGIAPLSHNALLGSLAQAQSDYQASIDTVTHTGPGGTTPQDRASAAGYGGGSFFYLSEIIYGGYNQTTQNALTWWQNSSLHNSIMLNSKYTEIGAGMASNGDSVYFTAVLGGPTGGSSSGGDTNSGDSGAGENLQPTQAVSVVMPVQKATPQTDGSIIHTVLTGQTLWTIAAIYEIKLETLFEINNLNQYSYVFPGDKITIRPAGIYEDMEPSPLDSTTSDQSLQAKTPEPKASAQNLGEAYSSIANSTPQSTPSLTRTASASKPAATPVEQNSNFLDDPMVRNLIMGALIILIIVMVASMFLQKPSSNPPQDE